MKYQIFQNGKHAQFFKCAKYSELMDHIKYLRSVFTGSITYDKVDG